MGLGDGIANDNLDPGAELREAEDSITDEQVSEAIEVMEWLFPGSWAEFIYVHDPSSPDNPDPDLGERAEAIYRNMWEAFEQLEFLKRIEDDSFRSAVATMLFGAMVDSVRAGKEQSKQWERREL